MAVCSVERCRFVSSPSCHLNLERPVAAVIDVAEFSSSENESGYGNAPLLLELDEVGEGRGPGRKCCIQVAGWDEDCPGEPVRLIFNNIAFESMQAQMTQFVK